MVPIFPYFSRVFSYVCYPFSYVFMFPVCHSFFPMFARIFLFFLEKKEKYTNPGLQTGGLGEDPGHIHISLSYFPYSRIYFF